MTIEQTTNNRVPRLVVAAIQGRSGKTTFTIGLLRALRERGLLPQGFKKGPDYIDPSWSTFASGVACRNLDAVMMSSDQIIHSVCANTKNADIAVIEGAMGIFDGLDWKGSNSTAELAYLLQAPVILVVSGQRITRSVAAIINGVTNFDPRIHVAGIVLNQVARARHMNIMTKSIEEYCDVPLLGGLPKTSDIEIPDRHLGLIPANEQDALHSRVDRLGQLIRENVDIDRLLAIANEAPPLEDPLNITVHKPVQEKVRIGVFKDRAFSFYYPENIEALEAEGAEIVYINALCETKLPDDLDGLYIGGGFPEMLGDALVINDGLRKSVKEASENNLPIYAECGGLMYLSKEIIRENNHYPMVGIFDCAVKMERKPVGHGYSIQRAISSNPFFPKGLEIKGHEFHNSRIIFNKDLEEYTFGFVTERGKGSAMIDETIYDGLVYKNTIAAYHHFHAASSNIWAQNFVANAKIFKKNK